MLTAVFVLALALTVVFGLRLALSTYYWSSHRDRAIEAWMPVGYVARSWGVPRELLSAAIGIDPASSPRQSLARLAEQRGESVEALIERLEATIAAHRGGLGD